MIVIGADNFYVAEGFGCQTTHSEDEVPSLDKPSLERLADVYVLAVSDPHSQGRMPVMIVALRLARQAVSDEVALRAPRAEPFALASYLVGSQQWLMEIAQVEAEMPEANEAAVHRALELASDALIRFGKACWDAGANILHCSDSLASCNVISRRTFARFFFPYLHVFITWKEYGVNYSILHICGNSTKVLEWYAHETSAPLWNGFSFPIKMAYFNFWKSLIQELHHGSVPLPMSGVDPR